MSGVRRVAHVVSTRDFVGGAERVLLALLEEGVRLGWSQMVVNPFAARPTGTPFGEAAAQLSSYHGITCDRALHLPRVRREVGEALANFDADLVHVHLFHALVTVASIRRGREARLLSHQHGQLYRSQGRRVEAMLDRLLTPRFDRIAACSEDVRQFLLGSYAVAAEDVVTIHNGWQGTPGDDVGLADRPTAVCVANLRQEKGHAVLLDAWPEVLRAVPNAELVLVGDGPLRNEIEAIIARAGLQDSVRLLGAVSDVWPHLAQAHVFVLPTLHEPFGIVAAEAMAAGLPVVASDVGGLPEFVAPGVNGELVPVGDRVALAAALSGLLSDDDRRARLGAQARATAAEYSIDRTVARYVALYEELCRDGPGGPT
jgi:glycosyltransferase involved in cell wall biosynthesis